MNSSDSFLEENVFNSSLYETMSYIWVSATQKWMNLMWSGIKSHILMMKIRDHAIQCEDGHFYVQTNVICGCFLTIGLGNAALDSSTKVIFVALSSTFSCIWNEYQYKWSNCVVNSKCLINTYGQFPKIASTSLVALVHVLLSEIAERVYNPDRPAIQIYSKWEQI